MLNRRTLRIKAMQTLFAYKQSQEANYALSLDFIAETFSPDLNSMEVQDKEQLKKDKTEASKVFKSLFEEKTYQAKPDNKVESVVEEAIRDYHSRNLKDQKHFNKTMIQEAEKIVDRYILILLLLVEFADLAEKDHKLDQTTFVKNLLIKAIRFNKSVETLSLRRNLNWSNETDHLRQWFKDILKTDEKYKEYVKLENASFKDDQEIVLHIAKNIVFKNELIEGFMEESDINWDEDRAIIKSLVTKTLKSIPEGDVNEEFELQELSYNWEDDKTFFQKLFEESIKVEEAYNSLIAEKTKNWDIERIAATDKVIIEMAIAEMINFPSIPVKVTINEYIEVAKRYSTPKSKVFINGVLDVIATELEKRGVIRKSGRGLIDNK
ncbi:MAG: transcription antitermination factor NusB [Fulvivirga sp.]|uniref:transcription antitermination factor NusB n=1 Tax=Fulvivirga sp. TaxID=1931237 RepID=UPI0032EB0778